jgi:hypothetical protein
MGSNVIFGNFDMYSRRIGFFYKNHEKIGSYFGLFLTLIYIFASIILFIYQIINTIKRQELKVYDTTIYAQEMPSIEANIDQLYFAFALEDPLTSNRFIDESIYIAKIAFIEKAKINDEFVTVNTTNMPIERCNVANFGKNYQHLFAKDELSNSYCLKDFNYTLTLEGGYKYERFTYIRLRIYPCVNSTSNNNRCKPQEEIDKYLTSGYFSIVIKDFGLNPSNYTFPVLPTFQDLYTTIDKRIYRNYILSFGVTEIRTDTGLFEKKLKVDRYLQYRKEVQTFSFRDEKDYYAGKSVILVQLRLDDTILVQTRAYTRIPEIFSRIGGYMQLMNTAFLLISSLINKVNSELKIINSIFKFNFKENKMILKLQSLKDSNLLINLKKRKNFSLRQKTSIEDLKQVDSDNKSKNILIIKDNDYLNISSLNISDIKKNNENQKLNQNNVIKMNHNKHMTLEDSKISNSKSLNDKNKNVEIPIEVFKENIQKNILDIYSKENKNCNDFISFNIFEYICLRRRSKKYKYIELYKKGNRFYKKKMDITHVFTLLSIIEDFVVK